jgi:hypothetical protein
MTVIVNSPTAVRVVKQFHDWELKLILTNYTGSPYKSNSVAEVILMIANLLTCT